MSLRGPEFHAVSEPDPTPFREPLKEHQLKPETLKMLPGRPDKIFRVYPLEEIMIQFLPAEERLQLRSSPPPEKRVIHEGRSALEKCRALFDELHREYNIPTADLNFIIGRDGQGVPSVYVETTKVKGQSLDRLSAEDLKDGNAVRQLDKLYLSLARYLIDRHRAGTDDYLQDIFKNKQFVYGTVREESAPRIYLTDVDPFVGKTSETYDEKALFLTDMLQLVRAIEETEAKIGKQFIDVRKEISSFLDGLPAGDRRKNDGALEMLERLLVR